MSCLTYVFHSSLPDTRFANLISFTARLLAKGLCSFGSRSIVEIQNGRETHDFVMHSRRYNLCSYLLSSHQMTECRIRLSFFFLLNPVFACSIFAYQRRNATTGVTYNAFITLMGRFALLLSLVSTSVHLDYEILGMGHSRRWSALHQPSQLVD